MRLINPRFFNALPQMLCMRVFHDKSDVKVIPSYFNCSAEFILAPAMV
jgi:hypothetical protein